jgi:hypothetical protein
VPGLPTGCRAADAGLPERPVISSVASDPWRPRLTFRVGGIIGLHDDHRRLAKLQILNHLPTNPAKAADDIVSFDLVDFLLHASSSPQGTTDLTADHVLPDGADRVRRGADTPRMSPMVNRCPAPDKGWTSVNPTVEMVMTVM